MQINLAQQVRRFLVDNFFVVTMPLCAVMVWGGISVTGKPWLIITGGSRGEVLQPVAILYFCSLWANSILQDDRARPHRVGFIRVDLQDLGVERMEWPACRPELNPIEDLWDQLGHAVCVRVTNETTLADLRQKLFEEWDAIPRQCVTSMRRSCQVVAAV